VSEGTVEKASEEKSRTARVSKLQLEDFFSQAAKRVATMAMRIQYTGFAEPSRIAQGW